MYKVQMCIAIGRKDLADCQTLMDSDILTNLSR